MWTNEENVVVKDRNKNAQRFLLIKNVGKIKNVKKRVFHFKIKNVKKFLTSVVFASHAFRHAAPSIWNNLPTHLTDLSLTQESFKKQLKTHLYNKSYRHWQSSCPRLRFSSLIYITIRINWHMARYQLCIIIIIIIIISYRFWDIRLQIF